MNDAEVGCIAGDEHAFSMESRGHTGLVEALKRGCLSPERLALKVGARVMFTKNNFDEGYVNGTLGLVVAFAPNEGGPCLAGASLKLASAELRRSEGGYPIVETLHGNQ